MAIFDYSGIWSLLFEYSNNIRSPKSDRISNRITLFGTQLFEYSNNSNYSFKHWYGFRHVLTVQNAQPSKLKGSFQKKNYETYGKFHM